MENIKDVFCNHKGKIVAGIYELKNLLVQEYKNRLRTRPVRNDYKSIKIRRKKIFEMKMMLAKCRKSPPWTMQQLETALEDLKPNKSRDYEGYINEIFKFKGPFIKNAQQQSKSDCSVSKLCKYDNCTKKGLSFGAKE